MKRLAVLATTAALLAVGLVNPPAASACSTPIAYVICNVSAPLAWALIIEMQDATTRVATTTDGALAVVSSTVDQKTARTLEQSAIGQIQPSADLNRMNISLECSAAATPNPLATGIQQCYLLGANGARYSAIDDGALPGSADASVHAVLDVPTQEYRVCVRSQAFFQDNVLLQAPEVCSA